MVWSENTQGLECGGAVRRELAQVAQLSASPSRPHPPTGLTLDSYMIVKVSAGTFPAALVTAHNNTAAAAATAAVCASVTGRRLRHYVLSAP